MPDDVGPALVRNDVNGGALLVMGREDLKEIGVTKAGPLALLLKEITNLCRENKSEAVSIDYNAYCFEKILDTLQLQAMCQDKDTIPLVYIQESHRERFKKIVDYLFPGESASFILQGREIDSTIFPNIRVIKLRGGWWRMEYLDIWSSCIGTHRIDGRHHIFMPSVTTRVQP